MSMRPQLKGRHVLQGAPPQLPPGFLEKVYEHWAARRIIAGRPLLQRLWCEAPWSALGTSLARTGPRGGSGAPRAAVPSPAPFTGRDIPPRMALRSRRMPLEDVQDRLDSLRCGGHTNMTFLRLRSTPLNSLVFHDGQSSVQGL